jgi:hypothetical protein
MEALVTWLLSHTSEVVFGGVSIIVVQLLLLKAIDNLIARLREKELNSFEATALSADFYLEMDSPLVWFLILVQSFIAWALTLSGLLGAAYLVLVGFVWLSYNIT